MSASATLSACVSRTLQECPAVCELLLATLSAAAAYGRLPFDQPTKLRATDQHGKKHSFLSSGSLDAAKLLATVSLIPPLAELLQAAADDTLAATLDALDPLLLPLLDWTLHCPDAYIRQLDADERFVAIPTDQQFAVCMPDREARFIKARREQAAGMGRAEEEAVAWCFHGSPAHNWHSILRTGLKNLSNTQWMTTGASHGAGIYLAPHSSTSLNYCGASTWTRADPLPRSRLLALCEIVAPADSQPVPQRAAPPGQPFVVVPHNERVCLRFVFALPETGSVAVTADQLVGSMSLPLKYGLQYPL